jgi:hypothetical protein
MQIVKTKKELIKAIEDGEKHIKLIQNLCMQLVY